MDFLKEVLGEKFDEFCNLIEEYNSKNPENAVSLFDLSQGEFVKKGDYDELFEKYEQETKALGEQTKKLQLDYALENALKEAGAKNIKAISALLDKEKISFEDGRLEGVAEQLLKLKESDGYLFEEKNVPKFIRPTSMGEEITREDFKKLSYMERLKLKKESPQLYSKLK